MAVRLAVGNDRLAELVRRDQDLGSEAESLDKLIMAAVSKDRAKRDPSTEQRARDRLSAIAGERAKLQKALSAEFPEYSALSNPLPLTAKEMQSLLSADEAMVLFAVAEKESYVLALTRDAFDWTPALLVTHWAVDSAAATRLTTSTFDRLKADPNIGRAEALRQAMLAYLNDAASPRNAYPALWGPFALIGEDVGR